MTLALPAVVLLPPLAVLALLAAVALASLRPPRQIRHQAQPGPAPTGITWLEGPPPELPLGVVLQDARMVPDSGDCVTGQCIHRSHRLRPGTRLVRYPGTEGQPQPAAAATGRHLASVRSAATR